MRNPKFHFFPISIPPPLPVPEARFPTPRLPEPCFPNRAKPQSLLIGPSAAVAAAAAAALSVCLWVLASSSPRVRSAHPSCSHSILCIKNPPFLVLNEQLLGFRKVDPDKWEFANESFLRGQRHLLKSIKRRKPPHSSPSQQSLGSFLEVGNFGYDGEIDQLKRDKQLLMAEVVKLRQEQQNTRSDLQAMEAKLQGTEQKQKHMMAFLARVMHNPEFMHQLISQSEMRKELEDFVSKKRRRRINLGPELELDSMGTGSSPEQGSRVMFEPQDPLDSLLNGVPPDLESSSVEPKGAKPQQGVASSSSEQMKSRPANGELNDDFWDDLLHEGGLGVEGKNPTVQDDMNLLSERIGYLNPNNTKSRQQ
ncbi:hypothetical protein ABZP36_018830 [Zizania latifolia]